MLEGQGNFGFNAAIGEYGDMMETGVLDPTKFIRRKAFGILMHGPINQTMAIASEITAPFRSFILLDGITEMEALDGI